MGSGGEGEGGYIISQQKVEEASLFWDRWRNFLLNNFLTPTKNNLSLAKRSFDQRVTRILKVSYTYVSY